MVTIMVPLYLIILVPKKQSFLILKNDTPHIKLSLSVRVIYIERSNEELHIKIMFTKIK